MQTKQHGVYFVGVAKLTNNNLDATLINELTTDWSYFILPCSSAY
jgi:hypothetical protein